MSECQDRGLAVFGLALLVALRYLEIARCISSDTVNSPLPHGTMTQTVSKQTVTFILWALYSAQILQPTLQYYNITRESSLNDQNFGCHLYSVMKLWINWVNFCGYGLPRDLFPPIMNQYFGFILFRSRAPFQGGVGGRWSMTSLR